MWHRHSCLCQVVLLEEVCTGRSAGATRVWSFQLLTSAQHTQYHPLVLTCSPLRQPLFRQAIRRLIRGNAGFPAQFENLEQRVVKSIYLLKSPSDIPAEHLLAAAVDDSAGIGGVVRRIEDAALLEQVPVARREELVVGPADNQLRPELRNCPVVEDATERAGR